jgi:hypothetical protein
MCSMKYDVMASCCSQCVPVKIMLYLMKLRKKRFKNIFV